MNKAREAVVKRTNRYQHRKAMIALFLLCSISGTSPRGTPRSESDDSAEDSSFYGPWRRSARGTATATAASSKEALPDLLDSPRSPLVVSTCPAPSEMRLQEPDELFQRQLGIGAPDLPSSSTDNSRLPEPRNLHPLVIFSFDNCIFPTSCQNRELWRLIGSHLIKWEKEKDLHVYKRMPEVQKQITKLTQNVQIQMAAYDRHLAMELRKLFQLGFQIRIASDANQAWLDLAMKHFLPRTNELLKDHPSYPQTIVRSRTRPGPEDRFIAHTNIVKEYVEYMRSRGQRRGLLMAVGDQEYHIRPIQTFMKDKSWLPETIHGYTILTQTDSNYLDARQTTAERPISRMKEMKAVIATMETIYDIHNNREAWERHMKFLRQVAIDGQSALDKALLTYRCISMVDNTVTNLQDETKVGDCEELKRQQRKNERELNLHCRFVLYFDWRTRIFRTDEGVEQFVSAPVMWNRPTFEETLQKLEKLSIYDEPAPPSKWEAEC